MPSVLSPNGWFALDFATSYTQNLAGNYVETINFTLAAVRSSQYERSSVYLNGPIDSNLIYDWSSMGTARKAFALTALPIGTYQVKFIPYTLMGEKGTPLVLEVRFTGQYEYRRATNLLVGNAVITQDDDSLYDGSYDLATGLHTYRFNEGLIYPDKYVTEIHKRVQPFAVPWDNIVDFDTIELPRPITKAFNKFNDYNYQMIQPLPTEVLPVSYYNNGFWTEDYHHIWPNVLLESGIYRFALVTNGTSKVSKNLYTATESLIYPVVNNGDSFEIVANKDNDITTYVEVNGFGRRPLLTPNNFLNHEPSTLDGTVTVIYDSNHDCFVADPMPRVYGESDTPQLLFLTAPDLNAYRSKATYEIALTAEPCKVTEMIDTYALQLREILQNNGSYIYDNMDARLRIWQTAFAPMLNSDGNLASIEDLEPTFSNLRAHTLHPRSIDAVNGTISTATGWWGNPDLEEHPISHYMMPAAHKAVESWEGIFSYWTQRLKGADIDNGVMKTSQELDDCLDFDMIGNFDRMRYLLFNAYDPIFKQTIEQRVSTDSTYHGDVIDLETYYPISHVEVDADFGVEDINRLFDPVPQPTRSNYLFPSFNDIQQFNDVDDFDNMLILYGVNMKRFDEIEDFNRLKDFNYPLPYLEDTFDLIQNFDNVALFDDSQELNCKLMIFVMGSQERHWWSRPYHIADVILDYNPQTNEVSQHVEYFGVYNKYGKLPFDEIGDLDEIKEFDLPALDTIVPLHDDIIYDKDYMTLMFNGANDYNHVYMQGFRYLKTKAVISCSNLTLVPYLKKLNLTFTFTEKNSHTTLVKNFDSLDTIPAYAKSNQFGTEQFYRFSLSQGQIVQKNGRLVYGDLHDGEATSATIKDGFNIQNQVIPATSKSIPELMFLYECQSEAEVRTRKNHFGAWVPAHNWLYHTQAVPTDGPTQPEHSFPPSEPPKKWNEGFHFITTAVEFDIGMLSNAFYTRRYWHEPGHYQVSESPHGNYYINYETGEIFVCNIETLYFRSVPLQYLQGYYSSRGEAFDPSDFPPDVLFNCWNHLRAEYRTTTPYTPRRVVDFVDDTEVEVITQQNNHFSTSIVGRGHDGYRKYPGRRGPMITPQNQTPESTSVGDFSQYVWRINWHNYATGDRYTYEYIDPVIDFTAPDPMYAFLSPNKKLRVKFFDKNGKPKKATGFLYLKGH